MAKDCPRKKDKGRAKGKKKATSNLVAEHSESDERYINTLEFESYTAAKTSPPTWIKAHHVLEKTIFINGRQARVLFDPETIGANLISAACDNIYCIPCTAMKEPTKILMAMKESWSESYKECTVNPTVDNRQTKGNKILVVNLAKYHSLPCPYRNAIPKVTRSYNQIWRVSHWLHQVRNQNKLQRYHEQYLSSSLCHWRSDGPTPCDVSWSHTRRTTTHKKDKPGNSSDARKGPRDLTHLLILGTMGEGDKVRYQ